LPAAVVLPLAVVAAHCQPTAVRGPQKTVGSGGMWVVYGGVVHKQGVAQNGDGANKGRGAG